MHKIEITAAHNPFSKLVVDGQDISNLVLDYSVSQKAGEIPIVTLHLDGTDMTLTEHCAFRFPKPVREFLEKLQKNSADTAQLKNLRKALGKDAPKDLAELQQWKYNEPEKWKDVEYYARNINDRPIEYVKIDRELEKLGIVNKGKAYPAEPIEIKGWRGHAEKRLAERGLTKEQAVAFMNQAKVMMKRYPEPNTVHNFYCKNGVIGVKAIDGIVQTAYGSKEFKTDTLKLLEVIDKYVPNRK